MNKVTSASHKHYSIPALEDYKQNITLKDGVFLIDLLLVFVSGTQHIRWSVVLGNYIKLIILSSV